MSLHLQQELCKIPLYAVQGPLNSPLCEKKEKNSSFTSNLCGITGVVLNP